MLEIAKEGADVIVLDHILEIAALAPVPENALKATVEAIPNHVAQVVVVPLVAEADLLQLTEQLRNRMNQCQIDHLTNHHPNLHNSYQMTVFRMALWNKKNWALSSYHSYSAF